MTSAIIYTRVSTSEQQEKGYSLFEQQRICARHCKEKQYRIVEIISDASSGFEFDRPGVEELKKYLPEADIVLATEIDRIARQDRVLGKIELLCHQHNAKLEFVFDKDTKGSTLVSDVKVATAKEENRVRMLRVQRGKNAKHQLGGHIAKPPFGYKFDRNRYPSLLVPDTNFGKVQAMFTMRAEGKTFREIIDSLSLYSSKKQRDYTESTMIMGVKTILSNPAYVGYVRFKNKLVKGKQATAIDETVFLKVNKCDSFNEYCRKNKLVQ